MSNIIKIFSNKTENKHLNKGIVGQKNFFRKQTDQQIRMFNELLISEKWCMINQYNLGKIDVKMLFDSFYKKYVDLWHYCSPLVTKLNNSKTRCPKSKKFHWYTTDLADMRNSMLDHFHVYKVLRDSGSDQTAHAYKTYLESKRRYRAHLTLAKSQACERFIEGSSNKCKAA